MDDNINIKLELLKYHQKAMESRRSIGFKAFLSLVTFDLIILKGTIDIKEIIYSLILLKFIIVLGFWLLFFIYVGFIIQIESWNKKNRLKYMELSELLYNKEGEEPNAKITPKAGIKSESCLETICNSWTGTWPCITLLFFTFGCSCVVCLIKFSH